MRFFILVSLIVAVVVALFYLVILPNLLEPASTQVTQTQEEKLINPPPANENNTQEYKDYQKVLSSKNVEICQKFLKLYPKSEYCPEIEKLLETLLNDKSGEPSVEVLGIPEIGPQNLEDEKDLPESWTNPTDESDMVLVRAGTFIRGSNESRNRKVEQPEMKIYVSSFYIDKYAVTVKQYRKFMDEGGYGDPKYWSKEGWTFRRLGKITKPYNWDEVTDSSLPVVGVSWYEAEAYCRWAGKMLPSEVQWEKAARGYFGQKFQWGNEWIAYACNWKDNNPTNPDDKTLGFQDGSSGLAQVYRYQKHASPFGAVQMCGNTFEWVIDQWSPSFFAETVINDNNLRKNPVNIETNNFRVLKGGSYDSDPDHCEPSWRHADYPERRRTSVYGFRCIKKVEDVAKAYKDSQTQKNSPDDDNE